MEMEKRHIHVRIAKDQFQINTIIDPFWIILQGTLLSLIVTAKSTPRYLKVNFEKVRSTFSIFGSE